MMGLARKSLRLLLLLLAGLTLLACLCYATLAWTNNRTVSAPERHELQASLERAIGWMEQNRELVLRNDHAPLWRMVRDAAELTGDSRLHELVSAYVQRHIDTEPRVIWDLLIRPDPFVRPPQFDALGELQPYQHLFIYGMTCAPALGQEPSIRQQLEPQFCGISVLSPRCVTHQLYGVGLLQENRCPETADLTTLVVQLQDRIVQQLARDPRVGDAYLQRVMMLAQTGAIQRIRPSWQRQVLDAQYQDGGWGDVDPLVSLPGGYVLGLSSQLPRVAPLRSIFHSTAQGLLAVSLLLEQPMPMPAADPAAGRR